MAKLMRKTWKGMCGRAVHALLLVAVAGTILHAPEADAAGLLSAARRSVAARVESAAAARTAARGATRATEATAAGEAAALKRLHKQLDADTLARIEGRYGKLIDPARLSAARRTPTKFMEHDRYQRQLRRNYPSLGSDRSANIKGNHLDGKTYVDRNQVTLPRTVAHERLHQVSHPLFRSWFGPRINEGATTYLAGRIRGDGALRVQNVRKDLSVERTPQTYPQERRIVDLMAARAGEKRIARAYFQGEPARDLVRDIDRQLGKDTLARVVKHVEAGDFTAAERLLISGSGPR